ncbi:hypothetical protein VCJ71_04360 [Alteriqipengyuania sp. WL0013]|uniref:hypothetical protein n=1 Tax=Alteriqipengyuania sp. WL0013 TaxID=3110773 RepID=UPI002BF888FA|nr:hypothetical protein [Alteriqipengyuania sp. WL0013]MEB3415293.1 hypothetical protein [Alteriqipengyuania sp. WL0013]
MIAAAERACFVALCALLLPPLGYSFFVILTLGIAGLGLLLGLKTLLTMIYLTGFIPTAVTATIYVLFLRRTPLWLASIIVALVGTTAAYLWWHHALEQALRANYVTAALLLSAAGAVSLIPAAGRARELAIARRYRTVSP